MAEVFDEERQGSDTFRVSAKIDLLFFNAYSGVTSIGANVYQPYANSLYYVNSEESFSTNSWSGYPQYVEFDLIRKQIKTINDLRSNGNPLLKEQIREIKTKYLINEDIDSPLDTEKYNVPNAVEDSIENDLDKEVSDEKLVKKFSYKPQLIIVDGGKPQVSAAARALEGFDIAFCGIAKRLEEVWLPHNSEPIIFPRHSEALYLLQKVRDEAHRFAINFHRSKRSKVMLESLLDEISGLGEIRRKSLLTHFGSVSALRAASQQEIANVPGIGEKMANSIYDQLANRPISSKVDVQTGEILDA